MFLPSKICIIPNCSLNCLWKNRYHLILFLCSLHRNNMNHLPFFCSFEDAKQACEKNNPCQNGGTCVNDANNPTTMSTCTCPNTHSGTTCQSKICKWHALYLYIMLPGFCSEVCCKCCKLLSPIAAKNQGLYHKTLWSSMIYLCHYKVDACQSKTFWNHHYPG